MIEAVPMKDKEREAEILRDYAETESNACVLALSEGENSLGYVVLDIKEKYLRLHDFVIADEASDFEKKFYIDFLMRAAASYGENRGADNIITVKPDWNEILKTKGFGIDEEHAFAPMSLIVHYHKKPE